MPSTILFRLESLHSFSVGEFQTLDKELKKIKTLGQLKTAYQYINERINRIFEPMRTAHLVTNEIGYQFDKLFRAWNKLKLETLAKISKLEAPSSIYLLGKLQAEMYSITFYQSTLKEAEINRQRVDQLLNLIEKIADGETTQAAINIQTKAIFFADYHKFFTSFYDAKCLLRANHFKKARNILRKVLKTYDNTDVNELTSGPQPFDDLTIEATKLLVTATSSISQSFFPCRRKMIKVFQSMEEKLPELTEKQQTLEKIANEHEYFQFNFIPWKRVSNNRPFSKVVLLDLDDTLVRNDNSFIASEKMAALLRDAPSSTLFYICTSRIYKAESNNFIISVIKHLESLATRTCFSGIFITNHEPKLPVCEHIFFEQLMHNPDFKKSDIALVDNDPSFLEPCEKAGFIPILACKQSLMHINTMTQFIELSVDSGFELKI